MGNLSFNLSVKVYEWSSLIPVNEIKSEVKTDSFSAKIVYSHSIPEFIEESNCVDRTECVVLVEIENNQNKLEVKEFRKNSYEPNHSVKFEIFILFLLKG